jgi:hypothetical protein
VQAGSSSPWVFGSGTMARHEDIGSERLHRVRWHRKGFQLFWRFKSKRQGRPRGIPEPLLERCTEQSHRHRLPAAQRVSCTSILGGLHHEYALERAA